MPLVAKRAAIQPNSADDFAATSGKYSTILRTLSMASSLADMRLPVRKDVATMIDVEPLRSVTPHGKFFSRKGQKFFLKAMRLDGVGATLDFDAKVRLLGRLDELKQVHTTALILTEAQSNPILDLASTVGLYSIVELEVAPEEIIDRRKLAEADHPNRAYA